MHFERQNGKAIIENQMIANFHDEIIGENSLKKVFNVEVGLVLLSLFCFSARISAHDDIVYYVLCNGIYYNINKTQKTAEVTYKDYGYADKDTDYAGDIIIPSSIVFYDENYIVTSIESRAFSGCEKLTSVTIPNSVTSIEYNTFRGCDNLAEINVNADNVTYASVNGVLYTKDMSSILRCPGGKQSEFVIPSTVKDIRVDAFYECSKLTSITIPNTVTRIGNSAFYGCTGLTSITIPNSVMSIGYEAFFECSGLTSIFIPNSVTSIGSCAFGRCCNLMEINSVW